MPTNELAARLESLLAESLRPVPAIGAWYPEINQLQADANMRMLETAVTEFDRERCK